MESQIVDLRNPDYGETLLQIEELKSLIEKLEKNISAQLLPQDTEEVLQAKENFMEWVEEAEILLTEYNTWKRG